MEACIPSYVVLFCPPLSNLFSCQCPSSALWETSQIEVNHSYISAQTHSQETYTYQLGKQQQVTSNEILPAPLLTRHLLAKAQSILSWSLFAPYFWHISYLFFQVLVASWACPCPERNEWWTCLPLHCCFLMCLNAYQAFGKENLGGVGVLAADCWQLVWDPTLHSR